MQLNFRLLPLVTVVLIATFSSCQKEAATSPDTDNAAEVKTHTDDQNSVSSELDAIANDANAMLETNTYFGGRVQSPPVVNTICGATAVADTTGNPRTITITYNGNNCAGTALRTGTVILSMPAGVHWHNAGAALTVTMQNLKIKRLNDNKSITINGAQTLTNVSGGLLANLSTLQTITHTLTSSNMSITFDNGTQRTWQVAHKRVLTYNNGIVLTVTGIGSSGPLTNVAEWGTNGFGHAFTTSITNALVVRQDCDWRLTAGEIQHQGFAAATVSFGLNSAGVPTGCPGTGHYYYKLTWTGPAGNGFSTIQPY